MRYSVQKMIQQGYILPTTDRKGQKAIQQKFKEILFHTDILNDAKLDEIQNKALGTIVSMIFAMNNDIELRKINIKNFYDNLVKFITEIKKLETNTDEKILDRMIKTFVSVMVSQE